MKKMGKIVGFSNPDILFILYILNIDVKIPVLIRSYSDFSSLFSSVFLSFFGGRTPE